MVLENLRALFFTTECAGVHSGNDDMIAGYPLILKFRLMYAW